MTTATTAISSIGHVCQTLQRSYSAVVRAVEELDIKPAVSLNGVPHFADESVERLAEHFAGRQGTETPG